MIRASLLKITRYGILGIILMGIGFAQDSEDIQEKAATSEEKLDRAIKVDMAIAGATEEEQKLDKPWLEASARAVIQAMTKDGKTQGELNASSKQSPPQIFMRY